MSDTTDSSTETTTDAEAVVETEDTDIAGADALGDAGKKALDAMKGQRNAARQELRDLRDRLAAIEAERENANKSAEEQQIEQARREGESQAQKRFNDLLIGAELRAAAKGKLADPSDAALYINTADITVSDDGTVDSEALEDAISDLLSRKPHLAAASLPRFKGDAGQGNRGEGPKPQVTRDELKNMKPEQINQARREGRLDELLGTTS